MLRKYLMFRRYLYILVTCLSIVSLTAQRGALVNTGSKSQSLGGITTLLQDSDAILSNFSALKTQGNFGLIIGSESRFGLSELTSVALGGFKHIGENGAIGISLSNYGFELYNEQTISALYMRNISNKVSISGELGYYTLSLNEFGSTGKPFYRIGLSGNINNKLSYGLIISNFEAARINENATIVSSIAFGLSYSVSSKIKTYIEIASEIESPLAIKVGLSYDIHPQLALRIGARTASGQSGGGFSYKISSKLSVEGHVLFHPVLGATPGLGIKYQKN